MLQALQLSYASLAPPTALKKPVTIVVWHSLADKLGSQFREMAERFNRQNPNYQVKLVYKGDYTESITNFAAAFRAKQPPALIHIFEVGTNSMLRPSGVIKSLTDLMQDAKLKLPEEDFFSAIRLFYSKDNKLQAMPLNVSLPVMYYNRDALEKIGYNQFPDTWQGMEKLVMDLKKAGYPCAYTTAYPSWIHIESFAAVHGISLFNSNTKMATYNNNGIVNHLERLKRWQNNHYFEYGGRTSEATIFFTRGRCPIFSQSSGSYDSLKEIVTFKLGVAAMPLDEDVSKERHNNLIGGGALWAVAGHSPDIYQGIAMFFAYLSEPTVQWDWYTHSGYLPIGLKGDYQSFEKKEADNPLLRIAKFDLMREDQTEFKPQQFGPQNLIRAINDDAMEAIFSNIKSVKKAMDEAVIRTNYTLMRFVRNTTENVLKTSDRSLS